MVKIFGWTLEVTDEHSIKVSFNITNLNGVNIIKQAFDGGKAILDKDLGSGFLSLVPVFSTLYEFIKKGKSKK